MSADDEAHLLSTRRLLVGVGWGVLLGLLVSLAVGERRQVSVELWLVFVAGWLTWLVIGDLMKLAPVGPERLRGAWERRRRRGAEPQRPRPLITIEGLLLSARDNERAMSLRLRPRLRELSRHFLATRHGIDVDSNPGRADALLGDLAFLIDPKGQAVAVDLADVDRLFNILLVDEQGTDSGEGPVHAR